MREKLITQINGAKVATRDDIMSYFKQNPLTGKPITITYERNRVENSATITPKLSGQGYSIGFGLVVEGLRRAEMEL